MALVAASLTAAVLVAALVAPSAAQTRGTRTKAPGLEPRVCGWRNTTDRTVNCFWLVVPEVWDAKKSSGPGTLLRLPVVVFAAPRAGRRADPVLFINGGPGVISSTAAPWAKWWNRRLRKLFFLRGRDLVIFDQRGVGAARPALSCREIQSTRPTPMNSAKLRRAVAACAARLKREGRQLHAYNTRANARDIAELRRQLRYKNWNLWGQSYGSRVALEVLRRHPEGVRAVIVDGPYPPQVGRQFHWAGPTVRTIESLLSLCAVRPRCRAVLPDPRAAWVALLTRFRERPVTVVSRPGFGLAPVSWQVNDVMLMWFLQDTLYGAGGLKRFPAVVSRLSGPKPDMKLLRRMARNFDLNVYGPFFTHGAAYTVACNDNPAPDKSEECAIGRRHAHLSAWIKDMLSVDGCPMFNPGGRAALDFSAVVSDVPTLVIAGEHDVATPRSWARVAMAGLTNARARIIPGATHDVSDSACAQSIMRAFLNRPTLRLRHACLAHIPPFKFDLTGAGTTP